MAKPSILIVDDEEQFRTSLSVILKEEFRIFTASIVMEGLTVVDKNRLSLILLDLQMPGMTGVELLETLRRGNNDVPVFILN